MVLLVYGYDWRLSEVAETLGVSKSTVQTHADRAMRNPGRARTALNSAATNRVNARLARVLIRS
ncbi:MAG: sigma factor-like helix-turn-helix DNA-binding protein [Acidimicrobiia bacterium]